VQRYLVARSRNRCSHKKATIRSLCIVVAMDAAVNNIEVLILDFRRGMNTDFWF
jgi:hypothetical protein